MDRLCRVTALFHAGDGQILAPRRTVAARPDALDAGGTRGIHRDLAAEPLPHLTLDGLATPEAAKALEQFLAADIVVIGAPMYNFGISSQLKSWFDHIMVAGKTFRYGESGPEGLAGTKRVIVAMARGGVYSEGAAAAMEHAETHLRAMLSFIGVTDPEVILAEGVAISPEQREQALQAALGKAQRVEPLPLAA